MTRLVTVPRANPVTCSDAFSAPSGSPGLSTPRFEAGSTTTGSSTAPSCIPSQCASTNTSFDGRCRSSNDCEANPPKRGDGSTLLDSASHNSSPTGTSSHQPEAGLWEPYDGRPSRTVLREREGEVPSRYSPGPGARDGDRGADPGCVPQYRAVSKQPRRVRPRPTQGQAETDARSQDRSGRVGGDPRSRVHTEPAPWPLRVGRRSPNTPPPNRGSIQRTHRCDLNRIGGRTGSSRLLIDQRNSAPDTHRGAFPW